MWQRRLSQLRELQDSHNKLEDDLREMQIWLIEIEKHLADPVRFSSCSEEEYQNKMKEYNVRSFTFSSVYNASTSNSF